MPIATGSPNTTFNPLGTLPKALVVSDADHCYPLPTGAGPQKTADPKQFLKDAVQEVLEGSDKQDHTRIRQGILRVNRFGLIYDGAHDYLAPISQPSYASLVPGAARNYLDHKDALYDAIPSVAMVSNTQRIQTNLAHLTHVQQVVHNLQGVLASYTRLESHLLTALFGDLQAIYRISRSAIEANTTLSAVLPEFTGLFLRGPEESLESRKNNERVAEEERNSTIDEVKRVLTQANNKPQNPTGPTPPSLDLSALDALKGNRNRNRGSSRE